MQGRERAWAALIDTDDACLQCPLHVHIIYARVIAHEIQPTTKPRPALAGEIQERGLALRS